MSLSGKITVSVSLKDSRTGDLETSVESLSKSYSWTVVNGTAAGQADKHWSDQRTLAASASEDLDLAGTLIGLSGATTTFVKLKAVFISAATGNTNHVRLTMPASNGVPLFVAASDGIDIPPGGVFTWVDPGTGVTVTTGTGDLLHVANAAGTTSVTYDVIFVGSSA
jgi:hypothetical protein